MHLKHRGIIEVSLAYPFTYNFVFSDNDGIIETVPVTFDYEVKQNNNRGGGGIPTPSNKQEREQEVTWGPHSNTDEETGWGNGERADIDDMVEGKGTKQ